MLQLLLDLSDRQVAEAVRCRIDFKYALAMELDDPGLHHSVLADFRDRLAQGDCADRLLDLALARLKQTGLVRERGTQRTDSTHVLAAVRGLTRLELITEAARAAMEEIAGAAPQLLVGLVDDQWGRRYGRHRRCGGNRGNGDHSFDRELAIGGNNRPRRRSAAERSAATSRLPDRHNAVLDQRAARPTFPIG